MFSGVFAGILLDLGFLRHILAIGCCFEVFGMLMTSFSTKYYQLLLAQGACIGMGSGMLLLTSLANLALYFEKKRMIAAGIVATGSSLSTWHFHASIPSLTTMEALEDGIANPNEWQREYSPQSCSNGSSKTLVSDGPFEPTPWSWLQRKQLPSW